MKLTNSVMDEYLCSLKNISEKVSGKFAYAVARNMRKLSGELTEYVTIKNKTIQKYGETDETGNSRIMVGTEAFDKYVSEMNEYANIEHEVELMMVSQDDLLSSKLNANEMLSVDFMIQEE